MSTFTLRSTEPGDADRLNALYREHTGIVRTRDQFLWEWFQGPGGPSPSWVVTEETAGRVVAHHGVVPCPIWCDGALLRAARTENSMVDPRFQDRLPYVSYEAMLLKRLLKDFDLIFTTTGKGAPGAIRKRLGYESLGRWHSFVIQEPPAYLAARIAGRTAGKVASALTPPVGNPPAGWSLEHTDDCRRVAALWTDSRDAYRLAPHRDADHLAWRLAGNPYFPARMAVAVHNGRDAGFVAWRHRASGHAGAEISLDDIFCLHNDVSSHQAVLALLRRELRRKPARLTLRVVRADTPLCLAAASFTPVRLRGRETGSGAEFLVRTAKPMPLPRPELTMLTTEGID